MSIMQRLGLYNNNLGGCEGKTFNHFLLVLLGIFPLFFVSAPNKRQQLKIVTGWSAHIAPERMKL